MTGRNLISTIRSSHRLLSTDSLLTDRAIFAEIKGNTSLLIKRETNLRRLWATDTLFTTIPCLEMIEVPISECCEYVDDCTVSRSRYKLPKVSEGIYQYIIQGVWSINVMGGKGKRLKEVTINRYINLLKLPLIKKEEYFWVIDGYLYCNNPNLKAIRVSALFEGDIPNEIKFSNCECGNSNISDEEFCKNPLDKEFALPSYLEKQVLALTSQTLLSTYFNIKTDQATDGVDGQTVNSKPTN